jgi:hypothetical protein
LFLKEDLDLKVLRIQNKNLSERLIQRHQLENDLRQRIDSLVNRKASDDSKMCIVDRYWTQLDEDLRLMLERFQCEVDVITSGGVVATPSSDNVTNVSSPASSTSSSSSSSSLSKKSSISRSVSPGDDDEDDDNDDNDDIDNSPDHHHSSTKIKKKKTVNSNDKDTKRDTSLKKSNQVIRNFLQKLNDWDKVEIEETLKERVKFTTQTISKLITNYYK